MNRLFLRPVTATAVLLAVAPASAHVAVESAMPSGGHDHH